MGSIFGSMLAGAGTGALGGTMVAPGIGTVIGGIGGAAVGLWQGIRNKRAEDATGDYFSQLEAYSKTLQGRADEARTAAGERPTYEIPQSVQDSLAVMEELSKEKAPVTADMPTLTEMPGIDKILSQVQSSQAGQIQAIKELGAGSGASIGAVSETGRQFDEVIQNIGIENARFAAEQVENKAYYDTDAAFRKSQWERGSKLNYADALNRYGQFEDQAFQINQMDPYNINMNRADQFQFAGDQAYYNTLGMRTGYLNEQAQSSQDRLMQLLGFTIKAAGAAAGA